MSHCHDEHTGHGHGHSHGHDHNHGEHDHSDDLVPALQNHVYSPIDFDKIVTLNESTSDSGAEIVRKTWSERLSTSPELVSDADEQLLMHIPFTGQIRLHSLLLRTSADAFAPMTVKLFVNREGMDFSTAADLPPTQTIELSQTSDIQDIPVKRALFNTVRSLDLFFVDNFSDGEEEETKLSYLGFKGEWMKLSREPISFLYEAAANPKDHKLAAGVGERLGSGIDGAGGRGSGM